MPASAARKARRANSSADDPVGASPSSPSNPTEANGKAPFVCKNVDGTEFTFPEAPPEHCKIMFPPRPIWENIMHAKYYTRIWTRIPSQMYPILDDLVKSFPGMSETFATSHRNVILVYDNYLDAHKRHYKAVFDMLKSQGIGGDYNQCKFEGKSAIEVGFAIEKLNGPKTPGLMLVDAVA